MTTIIKNDPYLDNFLRYASSLRMPLPSTYKFCIDGCFTASSIDLLCTILLGGQIPGLEILHFVTASDVTGKEILKVINSLEKVNISTIDPPPLQTTTTTTFVKRSLKLENLKRLDISGNHMGLDCLRAFSMVLRNGALPNLESLSLQQNEIEELGMKHLCETIQRRSKEIAPTSSNLPLASNALKKQLHLKDKEEQDSMSLSPKREKDLPKKFCLLKEIKLCRNPLMDGIFYMFPANINSPAGLHELQRLELSYCQLIGEHITCMSNLLLKGGLQNLSVLNLASNSLGDPSVATLLDTIANNPTGACRKLRELYLSNTECAYLTANSLANGIMSKGLPQLAVLDLGYNKIAFDGLAKIIECVDDGYLTELHTLRIGCNRIKDAGVHLLTRCIADDNFKKLRELDLSSNEIGGSATHLANVLKLRKYAPKLKVIKLRGNINTIEQFIPVFEPLVSHKEISVL